MSATRSRNSSQKNVLRTRIVKRDGNGCHYCYKPLRRPNGRQVTGAIQTLEHVVPLDAGGTWHISNLVLSCYECNHKHSNTLVKCECNFCANARARLILTF